MIQCDTCKGKVGGAAWTKKMFGPSACKWKDVQRHFKSFAHIHCAQTRMSDGTDNKNGRDQAFKNGTVDQAGDGSFNMELQAQLTMAVFTAAHSNMSLSTAGDLGLLCTNFLEPLRLLSVAADSKLTSELRQQMPDVVRLINAIRNASKIKHSRHKARANLLTLGRIKKRATFDAAATKARLLTCYSDDSSEHGASTNNTHASWTEDGKFYMKLLGNANVSGRATGENLFNSFKAFLKGQDHYLETSDSIQQSSRTEEGAARKWTMPDLYKILRVLVTDGASNVCMHNGPEKSMAARVDADPDKPHGIQNFWCCPHRCNLAFGDALSTLPHKFLLCVKVRLELTECICVYAISIVHVFSCPLPRRRCHHTLAGLRSDKKNSKRPLSSSSSPAQHHAKQRQPQQPTGTGTYAVKSEE
jgi:hypothetical protein